jgi:hypothetical protein
MTAAGRKPLADLTPPGREPPARPQRLVLIEAGAGTDGPGLVLTQFPAGVTGSEVREALSREVRARPDRLLAVEHLETFCAAEHVDATPRWVRYLTAGTLIKARAEVDEARRRAVWLADMTALREERARIAREKKRLAAARRR